VALVAGEAVAGAAIAGQGQQGASWVMQVCNSGRGVTFQYVVFLYQLYSDVDVRVQPPTSKSLLAGTGNIAVNRIEETAPGAASLSHHTNFAKLTVEGLNVM
jgi:hypothetical protein